MVQRQRIRLPPYIHANGVTSGFGALWTRRGLVIVALLVALSAVRDAAACTCFDMGSAFLDLARYAPVVVLGEVESNDGYLISFRVERALRGAVADRIEVTGDWCVPETHGIEVGSRLVLALQKTGQANLFSKESCRVTSLVAFGDRVYGRITGRRVRQYSPDYVNESVPIIELSALIDSEPGKEVCTDDGDRILSRPTGRFIPPRPRREIVPALDRDCVNERSAVKVRVFVDERGRVVRWQPLDEAPMCVHGAVGAAIRCVGFDVGTSDGRPAASWSEVSVSLPRVRPATRCSQRFARRQRTIIWARDGNRNVLTTIADRGELNDESLAKLRDLRISTVRAGDMLDALDEHTAPKLVELRDDPPCSQRFHNGLYPFNGEVLRVWSFAGGVESRLSYDAARDGRDWPPRRRDHKPGPQTNEAPPVAIQLSFVSDRIDFDPALFNEADADLVIIFLTRDGIVEPLQERLIIPPTRPVVPSSVAADFSSLWNRYLASTCHEPRSVVLEYQDYFSGCGHCNSISDGDRLTELGASWLTQLRTDLGLTRLRVVTGSAPQASIEWSIARPRGSIPGTQIVARHDAIDVGECARGISYCRQEKGRRESEIEALNALIP